MAPHVDRVWGKNALDHLVDPERGSSPRPCRVSEISGELIAKRAGIGFIGGARMGGTAYGEARNAAVSSCLCASKRSLSRSRDSSSLAMKPLMASL